jgi:N6-L-threonylcarbamoyladenine synthase
MSQSDSNSARVGPDTVILAIETSCDETAAAVVVGGTEVRSSVVSSQVDVHARYGGVVPEIASRAHVELLTPVLAQAIVESGLDEREIDAVAATVGPGLIGSLLVGVSAAKALSLVWGVPFVGVNHLEAHLYASFLEDPTIELPLVVLLVSGGHTLLVEMREPGRYRVLGGTIDDAAGEAFDKVARFLGLGYPGGPAIDQLAMEGDPKAIDFPRAMVHEGLDFSFSGLKTAVVNHVRAHPTWRPPTSPPASSRPWWTCWWSRPDGRHGRWAPRPWRSAGVWLPTRSCASRSSTPVRPRDCGGSCPAGPCARTTPR